MPGKFDYEKEYSLKHTFDHYARLNGTQRYEYMYIEVCKDIYENDVVHVFQVDKIEEYTGIPIKKYLVEKSAAYLPIQVRSWSEAKKYFGRKGWKYEKISGADFLQALRNMT